MATTLELWFDLRIPPHVSKHSVRDTAESYFRWTKEVGIAVNDKFPAVTSIDDLKGNPGYRVMTPEQCLEMFEQLGGNAQLHMNPMQGGLDPKMAWDSLKLFERDVLPYLKNVEFHDSILH